MYITYYNIVDYCHFEEKSRSGDAVRSDGKCRVGLSSNHGGDCAWLQHPIGFPIQYSTVTTLKLTLIYIKPKEL